MAEGQSGHGPGAIDALIASGADLNAPGGPSQHTPLLAALDAPGRSASDLGKLIDAGADPTRLHAEGDNAISWAMGYHHPETVTPDGERALIALLVAHGADVNHVIPGQMTALQRAIIQWMLDLHRRQGYLEKYTPFMVKGETLFASGQLPVDVGAPPGNEAEKRPGGVAEQNAGGAILPVHQPGDQLTADHQGAAAAQCFSQAFRQTFRRGERRPAHEDGHYFRSGKGFLNKRQLHFQAVLF